MFDRPMGLKLGPRRQSAVLVLVAVVLAMLAGFAGLTIDIGRTVITRTELQNTADAAAMAAVQDLGGFDSERAMARARRSVNRFVRLNDGYSQEDVTFDLEEDIVFGQARLDFDGGAVSFTPDADPPNAIRATVHSTVKSKLAQLVGFAEKEVSASAVAAVRSRDLMIVLDISKSMTSLSDEWLVAEDLEALEIPYDDPDGDDADVDSEGDDDSESDSDAPCDTRRVRVCHVPAGDPENARTIRVSRSAVRGHLRHGDSMGRCASERRGGHRGRGRDDSRRRGDSDSEHDSGGDPDGDSGESSDDSGGFGDSDDFGDLDDDSSDSD